MGLTLSAIMFYAFFRITGFFNLGIFFSFISLGYNVLLIFVCTLEYEDGYYVASVPELPGCHKQSKTLDKVMERIKEAVQTSFEVEGLKSSGRTELVGVQFVGSKHK